MLTVIDATIRRGFSPVDHLIRGDECSAVVGRAFRSLRAAQDAAFAALRASGCDRRLLGSPIRLEVRAAGGSVREVAS